jgi:hypothetical protein
MIRSDRNITFTCHLTAVNKERLRVEALRRGVSMSDLVSRWIDELLEIAEKEEIDVRKRTR